jgi:hypothetical protein
MKIARPALTFTTLRPDPEAIWSEQPADLQIRGWEASVLLS